MAKMLNLGWCQEYMGLKYHMEDALTENKLIVKYASANPPIAKFSKQYWNEISMLPQNKIHDFCFIGSLQSDNKNRRWVIEFAKKNFTSNSVFVNTDHDPQWVSLGSFDYSNQGFGFCPKTMRDNQSKSCQFRRVQENTHYFQTMCQSRFCLAPAGDSTWSFRFYEILMCKSLPVVESWHHTYRTKEEANIPYHYILKDHFQTDFPYESYVLDNTLLFEQYHLIHLWPGRRNWKLATLRTE